MNITQGIEPVLASEIKSRPQYAELQPDPSARLHWLLLAEPGGAGVEPVARRFIGLSAPLRLWQLGAAAPQLPSGELWVFPGCDALLRALHAQLALETMGLRLYACGPEPFLWDIARCAQSRDLRAPALQLQHLGSLRRRVQCVHCKTLIEDVHTQLLPCPGCGVTLLVRDHFSRRLGAFQGVQADVETPGVLPPVEIRFP